jgi:hypothetical protein
MVFVPTLTSGPTIRRNADMRGEQPMEALVYPPSTTTDHGAPGALPRRVSPPRTVDVSPAEIGMEINRFVGELAGKVTGAPHDAFVVDEIEMEVTVSAEGKVQLVLGSASASGSMVIKVRLKRRDAE